MLCGSLHLQVPVLERRISNLCMSGGRWLSAGAPTRATWEEDEVLFQMVRGLCNRIRIRVWFHTAISAWLRDGDIFK